jgi:fatty acid desaturase
MSEPNDLFWKMYEQSIQQIRHFQEERRSIANTVLILAGALMAVIGYDQKLDQSDHTLGLFLVLLGSFGVLCMVKCHERINYYQKQRDIYKRRLDAAIADAPIKTADDEVKSGRKWYWRAYERLYLYYHWILMFILIIVFGIYVMARISEQKDIPVSTPPNNSFNPTPR